MNHRQRSALWRTFTAGEEGTRTPRIVSANILLCIRNCPNVLRLSRPCAPMDLPQNLRRGPALPGETGISARTRGVFIRCLVPRSRRIRRPWSAAPAQNHCSVRCASSMLFENLMPLAIVIRSSLLLAGLPPEVGVEAAIREPAPVRVRNGLFRRPTSNAPQSSERIRPVPTAAPRGDGVFTAHRRPFPAWTVACRAAPGWRVRFDHRLLLTARGPQVETPTKPTSGFRWLTAPRC